MAIADQQHKEPAVDDPIGARRVRPSKRNHKNRVGDKSQQEPYEAHRRSSLSLGRLGMAV